MQHRPALIGTLAYSLGTFALAVVWHILLFEPQYLAFGYFEGEPNFALGLLSIVIQGLVLSYLYPLVALPGEGVARGLRYSLVAGLFFWTSHVLAFTAKQSTPGVLAFALMESFYLLLQFGLYGALIGPIYQRLSGRG